MAGFVSKMTSDNMESTEKAFGQGLLDEIYTDLKDIDCEIFGISDIANVIAGKYEIDSNKEKIIALSSENADAYEAKNLFTGATDYYALVFKKNLPIRLNEIMNLKTLDIPRFITPLEVGVTKIGDNSGNFLCIILQKPKGNTLKELILQGRQFNQQFILEQIVNPINNILTTIHRRKIIHGRINPSNIYIDENNQITLGECIKDLCGLSQQNFYETTDRAQCYAYGKGNGDSSIDYYAFGMTIFSVVSGQCFENFDRTTMIRDKLQDGSFNFINQHYLVGGTIGDLIRGLVIDDKKVRWGAEAVEGILQNRGYTVSNLIDKSIFSRALVFKEKEHFSKVSLANDLAMNWEEAKIFIKQDSMIKWLDISVKEQIVITALEKLTESMNKRSSVQQLFSKEDEHLIKVIAILDPEGPLRYKGITFYKDAVGAVLAHSIVYGFHEITQFVANSIFVNLFSLYEQIGIWLDNFEYARGIAILKKSSDIIKKGGYGFGIERCCYDLNSSLPCQSHIVGDDLCYGSKDVLTYIESHKIRIEEIVSKKNLLCFIASKIDLNDDIKISELKNFPILEKNKDFISLTILALAQRKSQVGQLKDLCSLYAKRVSSLLKEIIRGNTTKKQLFAAIDKVSQEGDLELLRKNATNAIYLEQDIEGFSNAVKRALQIKTALGQLGNKNYIEAEAKKLGLKLAVKVSYVVSGFSIISAIIKNF